MNKKTSLMLSILGIISIVLIATGLTYSFFNYAKEGTTENVMTSGSITFIYEEIDKQGAGIEIENAYPISDDNGKIQSASNEVFNFSVKSTTGSNFTIPYVITARKDASSTLNEEAIRIYLTEVDGGTERELLLNNYDKLPQTDFVSNSIVEKIIHTDTVPAGDNNYIKNYRLRMWIDSNIKFSPTQDENGNDVYEYNNKTFKITVNVYADAEVVTVPTAPVTMTSETALSIGDSVEAIDGSKWHVLEASAALEDTVVLLSDYNLNSDGTYNTTCGKDIDSNYVCSPMAFDSDNTNSYNESDSNNIGYFMKNIYEPLVINQLPGTTSVTLPSTTQIAAVDGQVFNESSISLTTSWLLTTNYWTQNNFTDLTDVWVVDGSNFTIVNGDAHNSGSIGVRSVITTLKSNLIAK